MSTKLQRKYPEYICHDCGTKFCKGFSNIAKRYATFHIGTCQCCGATDVPCTEPRDYGHFEKWPLDSKDDPRPIPQNMLELIPSVLDQFDFEKVHKVMTTLDWKWFNVGGTYAVPTIAQLKKSAERQLTDVVLTGSIACGSGGLMAQKYDDGLRLIFELASAESYFEDFV